MSEPRNREILEGLFSDRTLKLSPQEEYDKMRAFEEACPKPPDARVRRIIESGDLFVMEARSDSGDEVAFVANIVELRDGRIAKETRSYASPFEAPAWRAEWVEIMP